jgi:uncharacterized protein (DUF1330 family)
MPAYIIVNIDITDPEEYAEYRAKVPATIAAFGGRYLVRGGRAEALEGDVTLHRVAVVEFPTYERAVEWWSSEEYAPVKAIRLRSAKADLIVVEGI